MIKAVNPATGETIRTYEETPGEDLTRTVRRAHEAFLAWRRAGFAPRAAPLQSAAQVLRRHQEEYARLMALEMGKRVAQGRGEVEKCSLTCEYFAANADKLLADQVVATEASRSYVAFELTAAPFGHTEYAIGIVNDT
jgi:succinate-semialdehyde dehydrogenase/glutarate-semialdehyde dehydrogenase